MYNEFSIILLFFHISNMDVWSGKAWRTPETIATQHYQKWVQCVRWYVISLNLLKLKDLFELSVLKLDFMFKHNSLPLYTLNIFTESIRNPYFNLRARGTPEPVNPSTMSGEKCLCCYLPNFVKNASPEILHKVDTHSCEGFSSFIKLIKLNGYRMDCPWLTCIHIKVLFCIVSCISRLSCPSIDSLILFFLLVIFFFFFRVSFLFLCFFLYCYFRYLFLLLKFVNCIS